MTAPKTLHTALRVTELAPSRAFYSALGYEEVGRVELDGGSSLTMLKLPGDAFVSLELVHRPAGGPVTVGTGFSHLVVQVANLAAAREALTRARVKPGPPQLPGGVAGPLTSWLTDPDGYRIELVEWPAGHADGMTAADFA